MTFVKTFACACAHHSTRGARRASIALVALLLLLCISAGPSFARASACGAIACGQSLAVSLSTEAGEGEEAEESEEAEEEGEEGEGSSEEENEEEEAASNEAEEEAEAEERRRGRKRHGARRTNGALVLSKLRLTPKSVASLKHSPAASQVEFSFSLTKSMKVLVTLVKQGKPHAHKRWTALPGDSLAIAATKGSSRYRLKARNHLSAGRYRLTLWPSHGKPRSIYVDVRG